MILYSCFQVDHVKGEWLEDEDYQKNLSIAKDPKEVTESVIVEKSTELLKDNEIYKENKIQENTTTENDIKISKISDFFSYLLVFLISFVALIILLDTLKSPLINVFPGLEIVLFNLFETLKDVKLFIIDLT